MLTQERKRRILEKIQKDGQVLSKNLASEFGISEDTARRDLRELAQEGWIQRVHGGALPISRLEESINVRKSIYPHDKRAIGRAAAAMIEAGQVVFIDGGTTALQLPLYLDRTLQATIITHSPLVAMAFAEHAVEVILIGGRLFRRSMVTVGAAAVEAIHRLRPHIYFMGVTAIHKDLGFSAGDPEEAAIKRMILAQSTQIVVLASPEKFGALSPFIIAPLSQVTMIVTSETMCLDELAEYDECGVSILRAEPVVL